MVYTFYKIQELMCRCVIDVEQGIYDIPIIIGATGIFERVLKKNLEATSGKHSIDSLQKTAILGTSHTIWKLLQGERYSLSGGDHHWFKRSTMEKSLWQETATTTTTQNSSSSSSSSLDLHNLFCVFRNSNVHLMHCWL